MRPRTNWGTSTRRGRLPDDWPKRKAIVKARAHGLCQAKHHVPDCDGIGTDCDHIIQGDNHNLDNLQWLSHACHKAKTEKENAERNRMRAKMRRHPSERLPGLLPSPPRPGGEGLPRHRGETAG